MNKLSNKEEEIKNILGGLEIDIDTNDIWANIESELPQPKRKSRLGIFFLVGAISISIVVLTWSLNNSGADHFTTDNNASNLTENKIIASKENSTLELKSSTKPEIEKSVVEKSIVEIFTNNNSNTLSDVKSAQPISPLKTFDLATNDIHTTQKNSTSNHILINNEKSQINTSNSYESGIAFIESNIIYNSKIDEIEDIESHVARNTIDAINITPTLSSQLFEIAQRQRIESSPPKITLLHNSGRQLILQLKLGANQNRTSISNINSAGDFNTSEFDFERDRIGLSGTFNIGVENNGWRFLAGVSYHHHVSTYERDDVLIARNPDTGIEYYKISADGNTTAQSGPIQVTAVRDNEISYHRQHRVIDFHATIGKRLWSHKGFVLIADAGMGINTITNTSGYFLSDKEFGFTKIKDGNDPYKINTHWNAVASMELGYDFGKTRIGLSPFIRYNPNSITSQTHLYTLKNSQVGMQLSLTYSPTRE